MKEFPDNNLSVAQMMKFVFDMEENIDRERRKC